MTTDDTHGTPVMLKAEELGITPEKLIADSKKDHEADFSDFMVLVRTVFNRLLRQNSRDRKYRRRFIQHPALLPKCLRVAIRAWIIRSFERGKASTHIWCHRCFNFRIPIWLSCRPLEEKSEQEGGGIVTITDIDSANQH